MNANTLRIVINGGGIHSLVAIGINFLVPNPQDAIVTRQDYQPVLSWGKVGDLIGLPPVGVGIPGDGVRGIENESVTTNPTYQDIAPRIAIQQIVPVAAIQQVITPAAPQHGIIRAIDY